MTEIIVNKGKYDYDELIFKKRRMSQLKRRKNHPIAAMDTETYEGAARLICDDRGNWTFVRTVDDALNFMTGRRYRGKHVFFYNMDFDVRAVLKLLPEEIIEEIYYTGEARYKKWKIRYIQHKLFGLIVGRDSYRFYDLAQFYQMSLDTAAEKYLGLKKKQTSFNRDELNTNPQVWKEKEEEIIEYCCWDAYLTAQLGIRLQEVIKQKYGFAPQDYMSRASLSKRYYLLRCKIPTWADIPHEVSKTAFNAYKGGRFEVIKRGYFSQLFSYDIVSAYPAVMAELYDVSEGEWKFTNQIHEDAIYGFYLCRVRIKKRKITPIGYYTKEHRLIYPYGEWDTVLTKQEIEQCLGEDEYEIYYGWEWKCNNPRYIMRDALLHLFEVKKQTPKHEMLYLLTKILLNSMYGAFYEKVKITEGLLVGKLFNPVYASLITAGARIKLWEVAKNHQDDIVGFATDSVISTKKLNLKESDELGGWEFDAEGEGYVLMSGIYALGSKTRMRGVVKSHHFTYNGKEYDNLFSLIFDYPEEKEWDITIYKPVTLGEAITQRNRFTIKDINKWYEYKRKVSLNADVKRVWEREFESGYDFMTHNIDSQPHYVNTVNEDTIDINSIAKNEDLLKARELWDV